MPNIPVEISQGATLAYSPTPLSELHSEAIDRLFGAVGLLEWLSSEEHFHAGTAISGCGPAYLWVMIEALADAGVAQGLSRAVAQRLAAQTMLGSGAMALEAHPALLKDRVTSPGGVTIEGVRALERSGVRSALIEAVACATSRSQALDQASRTP
jgi:pyrroline-5-carboxylate reductase